MKRLKKFAPLVLVPVLFILLVSGKDQSSLILKGSLAGKVLNAQGACVAKAKLVLKSSNFQKNFVTDEQGGFEIPALVIGVYEIRTEPSGSGRPATQEVAVHLGRETFVTLVIREQDLDEQAPSNQLATPHYKFDDQGGIISQETWIDDKFYSMEYNYDSSGRLKTAVDNLSQRWDYEYTSSGKVREIRRTDGQRFFFNYDNDDNLWKIDLPWGYKIFYARDKNKFTKTVKKYRNLTLFEFSYTLDERGNKVEVEEGASLKLRYHYFYDKDDRLVEIRDLTSGERNSSVFKRKGKIYNSSVFGQIILKDGKYQDRMHEYGFDERGNIVYQRGRHSPVEVLREFNRRNLLMREIYLFRSTPVLSIEYRYDMFDRLILKSLDNGITYYYFRDKDGQVTHKIMRNMLTGEEVDGVSFSPYLSDFDQDGFELIKYKDKEKLFIRDAEGNRRYMVEIFDVLRYSTHYHQRNVHTDGDSSHEVEYVLGEILERINKPGVVRAFDFLMEYFDLPVENPAESGEGMVTVQSALPGEVGCYYYGYCAPRYSYCIDCGPGGGGEEPGPGGGGAPDCNATVSGPTLLEIYQTGFYSLVTDCPDPAGFSWYGGNGLSMGGTSYSTYWDYEGWGRVTVTFTARGETYEDPPGSGNVAFDVIGKNAFLDVYIYEEDEPLEPPQPVPDIPLTIKIVSVNTPSGGDSFIANRSRTGDVITVTGKATYGTSDVSYLITWTCTDNPYDSIVSGTSIAVSGTTGATCSFVPNPPGAETGRTAPLSYLIKARILIEDRVDEDTVIITQDNLDELRQEYEDLTGRVSQGRSSFDQDFPAFDGLLGTAAEPNRHRWHILRRLNQHALEANSYYVEYYGGGDIRFSIKFTSGYRCPVGNLRIGGAANSNHQYGKAFDFKHYTSIENYNVFWTAYYYAGARADTYLTASDGRRYRWDYPPPSAYQVTYVQGHAAWDY